MRYIVTGHNRSGTNMMFRCLVAGGIPTNVKAKQLTIGSRSYHPNPKGYFEYEGEPFPDGHIIKHNGMDPKDHDADCFAIVMKRDWLEVCASHDRAFGATHGVTKSSYEGYYEKLIKGLSKAGIGFMLVDYRDFTYSPKPVLALLKLKGLPIDIDKAVAELDDNLYRNKVYDFMDYRKVRRG